MLLRRGFGAGAGGAGGGGGGIGAGGVIKERDGVECSSSLFSRGGGEGVARGVEGTTMDLVFDSEIS